MTPLPIALKQADETEYWLALLKDTDMISTDRCSEPHLMCRELIAMLISWIKTMKRGSP